MNDIINRTRCIKSPKQGNLKSFYANIVDRVVGILY